MKNENNLIHQMAARDISYEILKITFVRYYVLNNFKY